MRGTRDIKSLDYDPVAGLVYWIDNGSNKCNGAQRRKGPNRNRLGFAIQYQFNRLTNNKMMSI